VENFYHYSATVLRLALADLNRNHLMNIYYG